MPRSRALFLASCLLAAVAIGGGVYAYLRRSAGASQVGSAPSASLRLSPSGTTVQVGAALSVDLLLDAPSQEVAAVGVALTHSSNLRYDGSDATGSVFPAQAANGDQGDAGGVKKSGSTLAFSRLRTDTGYKGTGGRVLRLNFTVTAAGAASIQVTRADSQALAYSDGSDILQSVTGATFVGRDKQVSLSLAMPYRSSLLATGIGIRVYAAGGSTLVASTSSAATSSAGAIVISDPAFLASLDDAATYDLSFKVPGYLARRVSGVTHLLTATYALPQAKALVPGDMDGNNRIGLNDLVVGINAFNEGTGAPAQLAKQVYGGSVTLARLTQLIKSFNETPEGDSL